MPQRTFLLLAMLLANAPVRWEGAYARRAQPVWHDLTLAEGALGPPLVLRSPDRRTTVTVRYWDSDANGGVRVHVAGAAGTGPVSIGDGVGSELLWSPDTARFAITTSDGGANGPYRLLVVVGAAGRPRVIDLTPTLAKAFGHPVRCSSPEAPNVGAIRWLGPDRIVAAAEVVAHSNCDSMGMFRAYVVDWRTRRIVASFGQIDAKRRFGPDLGSELRGANDRCVRRPRSCRVSTNH